MKGLKPETLGKMLALGGMTTLLVLRFAAPVDNSGVVIDTGSDDSAPKAGKHEESMGGAISSDGTKLEVVIVRPTATAAPRLTGGESSTGKTARGTLNGRSGIWNICDKVGPISGGICSRQCVGFIRWIDSRPAQVAVITDSCTALR